MLQILKRDGDGRVFRVPFSLLRSRRTFSESAKDRRILVNPFINLCKRISFQYPLGTFYTLVSRTAYYNLQNVLLLALVYLSWRSLLAETAELYLWLYIWSSKRLKAGDDVRLG